jgi:nucleotide-binding universal stress UspA family protein
MKPQRVLIPIDVNRCPLEVFELVNGFAKTTDATVILLYVLKLNVLWLENRVYEQLGRDANGYLDRLANKHLHPKVSAVTHVRFGSPAEQILAEAKLENVDLLIFPTFGPSLWNRVKTLWTGSSAALVSRLGEKLIREASCAVFVVLARNPFDCERAWRHLIQTRQQNAPGSEWTEPSLRGAELHETTKSNDIEVTGAMNGSFTPSENGLGPRKVA